MKKKISLLICVLLAVFSFTACTSNKQEVSYDEESLTQVTEFLLDYCVNADEAAFEQWYDMSEFNINLQLANAGLPFDSESFLGVLRSWQAGVDECGAYIEHGDYEFEVTNGNIEATADAKFENRDAQIVFVFDSESNLESMTINAKMGMQEILKKSALNTVLGMGTVFAVLILIAFIISLFKYIPAIQAAFSKKSAPAPTEAPKAAPAAAPVAAAPAAAADDSELIAVIAAAIAAAEGTTTDGFIVRSIRRRPSNKWNSKK